MKKIIFLFIFIFIYSIVKAQDLTLNDLFSKDTVSVSDTLNKNFLNFNKEYISYSDNNNASSFGKLVYLSDSLYLGKTFDFYNPSSKFYDGDTISTFFIFDINRLEFHTLLMAPDFDHNFKDRKPSSLSAVYICDMKGKLIYKLNYPFFAYKKHYDFDEYKYFDEYCLNSYYCYTKIEDDYNKTLYHGSCITNPNLDIFKSLSEYTLTEYFKFIENLKENIKEYGDSSKIYDKALYPGKLK